MRKIIGKGFLGAVVLLFSAQSVANEISRNNYVDWVAASSAASSNSHFIQWKNSLNAECTTPTNKYRTRISVDDTALFSLLLAAKTANKKVGFYYSLTTTGDSVPGHVASCQIVNAWLESD